MVAVRKKQRKLPAFLPVFIVGTALIVSPFLPAVNAQDRFDTEWPPQPMTTFPAWLSPPQLIEAGALSTIQTRVTPPQPGQDLLVTFFFIEPEGGFLRVLCSGNAGETVLTSNLYEGTGLPHQRSLLIPARLLGGPAVLTMQSSGRESPFFRMIFEWVGPERVLAGDRPEETFVMDETGKIHDYSDLQGAPYLPAPPQWKEDVVYAPLTDRVERLDTGIEFVASLGETPLQARMELEVAGLPPDERLALYINGQYAGDVAVDAPPLNDPGYYLELNAGYGFAGWRKGNLVLDPLLLAPGDNTLYFGWEEVDSIGALAIKDLALELRYPIVEQPAQPASLPEPVPVAEPEPLPILPTDPDPLPHGELGPHLNFMATEPTLLPGP